MWEHSGKVAFVGVGCSEIYRRWEETAETSLGALAIQAARMAIEDAGLSDKEIDGVFTSPGPLGASWSPGEVPAFMHEGFKMTLDDSDDGISKVTAAWLARNMGMKDLEACEDPGGMISNLLNYATDAVAEGKCNYALVLRPLNNFAGRYGQGGENASDEARGPAQFTVPYGFTGPAQYAMLFSRYLDKYGRDHDEMADFMVNNRRNGLMTEYGYYYQHRPEPLTKEDYINGRWIAKPINIYDCDLPVQVAMAFIITSSERAKDLKQKPVYVLSRENINIKPRSVTYVLEDVEQADADFAKSLYAGAGLGPDDMQFANLYDGYTTVTPMWIEAFGLAERGQALSWLTTDRIAVEGSFPLNTCGGNSGVGRTHGSALHLDAILQIQGRANKRQIKDHDLCVVETGPLVTGGGHILCSTSTA